MKKFILQQVAITFGLLISFLIGCFLFHLMMEYANVYFRWAIMIFAFLWVVHNEWKEWQDRERQEDEDD